MGEIPYSVVRFPYFLMQITLRGWIKALGCSERPLFARDGLDGLLRSLCVGSIEPMARAPSRRRYPQVLLERLAEGRRALVADFIGDAVDPLAGSGKLPACQTHSP